MTTFFHTRCVNIGDITIGGDNPVSIQSMTNTNTLDTDKSVEQIIRIFEAGAHMVRLTTRNLKEAENLRIIKKQLKTKGYNIPLIADVHFRADVAEYVARIVEKVRINPGNYVDKITNKYTDFSDEEYEEELIRIRKRIAPLLSVCKEYGTAIRIGINHGSLSQRILSRFGNTPLGMVTSAMEFINICRDLSFHNIVISMKASSPNIMIYANRLLVKEMISNNMNYPIHLGVTEAGEGEDGRIKSSLGIGTLLALGIGDTIRVSLTEPPENEVPVAKMIIKRFAKTRNSIFEPNLSLNPTTYNKRETIQINNIGANMPPVLISNNTQKLENLNFDNNFLPDYIISNDINNRKLINKIDSVSNNIDKNTSCILYNSINEYIIDKDKQKLFYDKLIFISLRIDEDNDALLLNMQFEKNVIFLLEFSNEDIITRKKVFNLFQNKNIKNPVIIHQKYNNIETEEELRVSVATDIGALLIDGLGDGIMLSANNIDDVSLNNISYSILQATGTRVTKVEYISCPTCGRTLFDIQDVVLKIKEKTKALKGFKIAVMGCIVNGPGEMADADYGYVGAGKDKVHLYYKQKLIKKNVDASEAVDVLLNLIKKQEKFQ